MAELRRSGKFLLLATSLALCFAVFAQSPGKIEISKMNPAGLLVDKYSYMSQPYSFYYFHHMDELGLRTDWIRRGSEVYPLTEPAKDLRRRICPGVGARVPLAAFLAAIEPRR